MTPSGQQQPEAKSATAKVGASRVSVACLPCRTRHIRCDATKPICKRCEEDGKECNYAKSRRGGLDRAALAARRERLAKQSSTSPQHDPGRVAADLQQPLPLGSGSSIPVFPECFPDASASFFDASCQDSPRANLVDASTLFDSDLESDPFIDLYYKCFHTFHPLVLPRHRLQVYSRDATKSERIKPVVSGIRYIGSLYARSDQSGQLAAKAASDIADARAASSPCPFLCQAQLLYSIVLFWSSDRPQSQTHLDDAIDAATLLGMSRQEFADAHSDGDAVLAESWRRTWWQLYIVDSHYAAIRRDTEFRTRDIPATADLPCEEQEYNAGVIPTPDSLADFDSREFASDNHVYSSFAYLIGATRGVAQIMAATPPDRKTSPPIELVEAVDAMIDGWLLLLPECKRPLMSKTGEMDELLFYAHMSIHAYMVGLHRPYSNLLFDPLEKISSCFVCPPESHSVSDTTAIHTMRCLASIEAQVRIMTLPKRPFCHSPFTLCMVTTGTIPFLSACKFLFTGAKLSIAREQIRLTIGCLKSLGEVWPQGARTVKEIQAIAREVLGLGASAVPRSVVLPSDTSSGVSSSQRSPLSQSGSQNSSIDDLLFPDTIDSLSSCWDMQNQQIDMNLWFSSY
ncbi:Zn(2)-Cys(6) zinc finger domain protein [Metarhizium robertsii]|uniref:Transcription factor, fungi n=2 Tax=Metarhizium robertsii TaxID=568076 RepID=E9FBC5_METRA|nr:uncharacterized protein MAA_09574 [Metarhizium robertsii ARSEF 23]EFY94996.1 Transcription factor, fungi [Metarhizium robertsii ARSEF 23]EXU96419.1 Zn(2)-Cys(6) zinc finger domain protein [Metarhizium robertsii]